MYASMADLQSATAEIRRGKKIERKKERKKEETTGKDIMACPMAITTYLCRLCPPWREACSAKYLSLWHHFLTRATIVIIRTSS